MGKSAQVSRFPLDCSLGTTHPPGALIKQTKSATKLVPAIVISIFIIYATPNA